MTVSVDYGHVRLDPRYCTSGMGWFAVAAIGLVELTALPLFSAPLAMCSIACAGLILWRARAGSRGAHLSDIASDKWILRLYLQRNPAGVDAREVSRLLLAQPKVSGQMVSDLIKWFDGQGMYGDAATLVRLMDQKGEIPPEADDRLLVKTYLLKAGNLENAIDLTDEPEAMGAVIQWVGSVDGLASLVTWTGEPPAWDVGHSLFDSFFHKEKREPLMISAYIRAKRDGVGAIGQFALSKGQADLVHLLVEGWSNAVDLIKPELLRKRPTQELISGWVSTSEWAHCAEAGPHFCTVIRERMKERRKEKEGSLLIRALWVKIAGYLEPADQLNLLCCRKWIEESIRGMPLFSAKLGEPRFRRLASEVLNLQQFDALFHNWRSIDWFDESTYRDDTLATKMALKKHNDANERLELLKWHLVRDWVRPSTATRVITRLGREIERIPNWSQQLSSHMDGVKVAYLRCLLDAVKESPDRTNLVSIVLKQEHFKTGLMDACLEKRLYSLESDQITAQEWGDRFLTKFRSLEGNRNGQFNYLKRSGLVLRKKIGAERLKTLCEETKEGKCLAECIRQEIADFGDFAYPDVLYLPKEMALYARRSLPGRYANVISNHYDWHHRVCFDGEDPLPIRWAIWQCREYGGGEKLLKWLQAQEWKGERRASEAIKALLCLVKDQS